MNDDAAWALLESARSDDAEAMDEQLVARLSALPVDDILGFERFVQERMAEAFRWDLWEVAYIMNGGCSDDGFDYFLGWLIAKGRAHYEAALLDPEKAGDGVSADDEPFEQEDILSAAVRAYEAKTGKADFYDVAPSVTRTLVGEPFDEDTVDERHPTLAKKFGMA